MNPQQPSAPALKCPLCWHSKSLIVEQLSGKELRLLWQELGHEFSAEAWDKIQGDFAVARHQCESCGFEFFDSSLTGNAAFYRELERAGYFAFTRPEFDRTLNFAGGKG